MRWFHFGFVIIAFLLMIMSSACGAPPPSSPIQPTSSPSESTTGEAEPVPAQGGIRDPRVVFPDIEMAAFNNPTDINNTYFPLTPGLQYIYDGFTRRDNQKIPHRKIVSVTELTKEVAGVETLVTYTEDYRDGKLLEAEIAFYAQDDDGNVWFMGEYPEVYEAGEVLESHAWISGLDGAEAGIVMPAEPEVDSLSYAQGWGPNLSWTDRRQIVALDQKVCARAECYEDVLVTEEFSQEQPDSTQVKFYAPDIGEVKVGWSETLELSSLTELTPEALAEIDSAALELEASALVRSKEVYAATVPIKYPADPDPTAVAEFWAFDPANFIASTVIDNLRMPLQPGTRWVHEGTALDDEGNSIIRRIEFTVTDLTKEIAGVQTVVAWIVDYTDGEIVEKEIAFYAQDKDGNVWYLGEYPEEYEEGEFAAAHPWIHGLEDARAGIKMLANPELGLPNYYQGWGPAVDWSDFSQVDQVAQETCVPAGCYQDVLVIAESSLGETDAYQLKYYAPNVGEVRVDWRGVDTTQEELELLELTQLSPEELAEFRAMALELEQHAYEVSSGVYGETSPMK
jgi:hypothetical protein